MARFTMKSKISQIIEDEEARAIIEKYLPNVLKHPDLKYALNMSAGYAIALRGLVGLTKADALKLKEELLALQ